MSICLKILGQRGEKSVAEDNCQKIKLLKLMELLRQETDEQHPMTKAEACRRLGEMGISCDPRTMTRDIKVLHEFGYEIMPVMLGHDRAYYIDDRNFSVPELKILIDAVQAANFIPEEKSAELMKKIAALAGSNAAEVLTGNLVRFNTRKHNNDRIYYTVQALEGALRLQKKASFCYFDLNEKREKIYRKDHARYIVDPVALVYSDDNYYLMCYSEKHKGISNYRLDRMDAVAMEEDSVCKNALALTAEVGQYTEQVFRMFTGKTKTVTLEFDPTLIGVMFDKFGEGIEITRTKDSWCRAKVNLQVSRVFFGWVFQFAGKKRIIGPKAVREEFAGQIEGMREALRDEGESASSCDE